MIFTSFLRETLCRTNNSVLSRTSSLYICTKAIQNMISSRGLYQHASQLLSRKASHRLSSQVRGMKSRKNPLKERQEEEWRKRNRTVLTYIAAAGVGMIGMSYAAVPLYRLYCQVSFKWFTFLLSCSLSYNTSRMSVPKNMRSASETFKSFCGLKLYLKLGAACKYALVLCLDNINMSFSLQDFRTWWDCSIRSWRGASREHDSGEGPRHQNHLQCRCACQHAMELQTSTVRDICKTCVL